jgi:hypothetical protein
MSYTMRSGSLKMRFMCPPARWGRGSLDGVPAVDDEVAAVDHAGDADHEVQDGRRDLLGLREPPAGPL